MSVEILFSQNLDCLAADLADALIDGGRQADPFQQRRVIVPNPQIKKWLQLTIAERHGIAANIAYPYLQDGLWDLLRGLADEPDGAWQHLTPQPFQLLVFAYLAASLRQGPEIDKALEPIAFMLYDPDGRPCLNFEQRLWQLAGQLAMYLREYEFHRQDMIRSWERGELGLKRAAADDDVAQMATCQMTVYRALFSSGGLRDRVAEQVGVCYYTLPQLARRVLPAARARQRQPTAAVSHIFGLSQMSGFRRDLIMQLGEFYDIRLYQLNVCSEFWEDVSTPREDRWARLRGLAPVTNDEDEEELEWDADENELLKSFGKPGRENVKLLSEMEERASMRAAVQTDWLAAVAGEGEETCLGTVQRQVLTRSAGNGDRAAQDDSVQIAGCPSMFREVETVHNSIIHNLRQNPELRATDVAILVPSISTYKPVIRSVFERGSAPVDYNLTDSTASRDSAFGQALLQLLQLAAGDFSRREVFQLVFSPCFLAAHGLTREDARTWVEWAAALNIFHSFDAAHRAERGLTPSDLYTWQQGLRRLRLGRIMETEADHYDTDSFRDYAGVKAFEDVASADGDSVGRFSLLIESLFRRLADLQDARLSCEEWMLRLRELSDLFLGIPADRPEEGVVRQRLFEGLQQTQLIDSLLPLAGGEAQLSLSAMIELLETNLEAIVSRKGRYLSGGVNVGELRPNRAIPFSIVYVMGLGEGEFPRSPDYSSLDLRRPGRRIGDISRPEEDRYVFLETLMCTRRKLYLTYVNHDLQKDQVRHPCSLIVQMQRYLQEHVIEGSFQCVRVPLTAAAPDYLRPLPPWQDLLSNYVEHEYWLCLQSLLRDRPETIPDAELRERLAAALAQRVAVSRADAANPEPEAPLRPITLTHLYHFLLNPVEAGLRWRLQLYEWEEEDPVHISDEPFFSPHRTERQLVLQILDHYIVGSTDKLLSKTDVHAYANRLYEDSRLKSQVPEGAFGDLDRQRIRDTVEDRIAGQGACSDALAAVLERHANWELFSNVSIGSPNLKRPPQKSFAALTMKLQGRPCEVSGDAAYVWRQPDSHEGAILVLTSSSVKRQRVPSRSIVRAFLFYVLLRALPEPDCDWLGRAPVRIYLAGADGIQSFNYEMSSETAREYLHGLITDLTEDAAFDLIPFELVTNLKGTNIPHPYIPGSLATSTEKSAYVQRLQLEAAEAIDNPFSSWYPSPLISLVDAKVPKDAWDKLHRRLTVFFDVVKEPG